jgi:SAM-dependent methyltransferase
MNPRLLPGLPGGSRVRYNDQIKALIRSLAAKLGLGDAVRRFFGRFVADERRALAKRDLRGAGLELGPLHVPLPVGPQASVRTVDRLTLPELRRQYPELGKFAIAAPDVVDDGERLEKFADGTLDFVVANHFLEHCQNPIASIQTFLRVLRPGGRIFMAIPDKRRTFDVSRPITTFEHVLRDYRDGPRPSYEQHLGEWASYVEKTPHESIGARVQQLREQNYSIHFHCWDPAGLMELFSRLPRDAGLAYDVVEFLQNGAECLVILEKASA